jgi:phage-related protein
VRDLFAELWGIFERGNSILPTIINTLYAIFPAEVAGAITDNILKVVSAFQMEGVTAAIQVVIDKFAELSPGFAIVKGVIEAALPAIQAIITSVFGIIAGTIDTYGAGMLASVQATWNQIWILISGILPPIQSIVATVFGAIATFLQAHGAEIQKFLATTWDTIAKIIQLAVAIISGILIPAFQTIAKFLAAHSADIQNILSSAWNMITGIISTALNLIQGLLRTVLAAMQGDWSGAWSILQQTSASFVQGIIGIVTAFLNTIAGFFGTSLDKLADLWRGNWAKLASITTEVISRIVGMISAMPDQIAGVGGNIIQGIVNGIENAKGQLYDMLRDIAHDALQAAKDALGISSPSKLFAIQVGAPIAQGIAQGMAGSAPLVYQSAQNTAGAALSGGRSIANTYNQSRALTINYNGIANAPTMDYAQQMTLAGM